MAAHKSAIPALYRIWLSPLIRTVSREEMSVMRLMA